jgi:hypothetical protein
MVAKKGGKSDGSNIKWPQKKREKGTNLEG